MIGEAVVIGLGLLGLKWMLFPEFYTDSNINSIKQDNGAKPSPTPAVLRPSTAAKHKVRVTLYKLQ